MVVPTEAERVNKRRARFENVDMVVPVHVRKVRAADSYVEDMDAVL